MPRPRQTAAAAEQSHASLAGEIDDIEKQTTESKLSSLTVVDARIEAAKSARDNAGRAGNRYASAQSTLTVVAEQQQNVQRNMAELEQQLRDGWTGQAPSEAEIDERIRSIRQVDTELEEASAARARRREELAGVETRYASLVTGIEKLEEQTKGAPAPPEVDAKIETIQNIETELERIRDEQEKATDKLGHCDRAADKLAGEEGVLWEELDALRVKVIRHVPPKPDRHAGLARSWDAMTVWAAQKAAELQERINAARGKAATLAAQRQKRLKEFLTELAQLDPKIDSERIVVREADIGDVLAASEERAKTDLSTVRAKRQNKEKLEARYEEARNRETLAARLATLLGARSFQRWRLASAFEQLVAGASRWLRELSGTGYSLTHTSQLGLRGRRPRQR